MLHFFEMLTYSSKENSRMLNKKMIRSIPTFSFFPINSFFVERELLMQISSLPNIQNVVGRGQAFFSTNSLTEEASANGRMCSLLLDETAEQVSCVLLSSFLHTLF